jgi:hypothetical protein
MFKNVYGASLTGHKKTFILALWMHDESLEFQNQNENFYNIKSCYFLMPLIQLPLLLRTPMVHSSGHKNPPLDLTSETNPVPNLTE